MRYNRLAGRQAFLCNRKVLHLKSEKTKEWLNVGKGVLADERTNR